MPSRRLTWILLGLFFLASFIISNSVELIVDYFWFSSVGYYEVFIKVFSYQVLMGLLGGAVAFGFMYANLALAARHMGNPETYLPPELLATSMGGLFTPTNLSRLALVASALVALMSGLALASSWEKPLLFFNSMAFGDADPVFGLDASFYIFTLPFLDQVQSFLWSLGVLSLLGVGGGYILRLKSGQKVSGDIIALNQLPQKGRMHLGAVGAFLLVVLAAGLYLDRFELLHQTGGLFTGPGYADINGTLPVLALKTATALLAALALLFALARERMRILVGLGVVIAVVWIGGNLYASFLQRFVVTPNELEKERVFLEYHIKATNRAFGLTDVEERSLSDDVELTLQDIANNRPTINNVRLWDHEPLLDTFSQIQEIRTYYEFVSVDNDRYQIGGELRQTMLSPREMSPESLPSRTWINERLTYTHGYGLTLGPVNRVNEQGLPVLFVQDLPPDTDYDVLKIDQPEIYYGELTRNYVFVNTRHKEFDYPKGDSNVLSDYKGLGGVSLGGILRRLVFSIYLGDMKLLLSEDFLPETRVMIHRNITSRVKRLAPFLTFDNDPYMVIHQGRLVWMFDGYTISRRYPYAEMVGSLGNYMRNPVKATVDARDGTVTFYLIDPREPIARAYAQVFPGLFRPISEMPAGLREHLRHPQGLFTVQTHVYSTYHMLDVNTFYNKEDQWDIPVVENKRMEPYYTVMKLPEETREEFIQMLPFTPRAKDNMAAWMVARSDGDNYGKLVVYNFPKQKLIYGPKHMVNRFNQDPLVSQQITLWDASGSKVIRGTLLVIPIESSLIYVQPLYMKADDGRIPELKRVVVGYQNKIAMGLDLEDALAKIFGGDKNSLIPENKPAADRPGQKTAETGEQQSQAEQRTPDGDTPGTRAMRLYQQLQQSAGRGDWESFGRQMEELGREIEQLQLQMQKQAR